MNLNSLLGLAANALLRNQVALGVAGHNVANVNTEGYSRQRVVFTSERPSEAAFGQLGNGVNIQSIRRQVDTFLYRETNRESQFQSRWEAQNRVLNEVETILTENEEYGINKSLNDFWNAWSDLANEPGGYTERNAVVSAANKLAQAFESRSDALNQTRRSLDVQIQGAIAEVNSITERIRELNSLIQSAETGRDVVANDLRDKRDQLVDELATYLDIEYLEESGPSGEPVFHVFLSGGSPLVSGQHKWDLSADDLLSESEFHDIKYMGGSNQDSVMPNISKGKLAAWLTLRDETIPGILEDLDLLAASVVNEVNKLHYSGYGLDGTSGNRFFEILPPTIQSDDRNAGHLTLEGSVFDITALTMDDYRIEFISGTEFRIVNERTGDELKDPTGAPGDYVWTYASGIPIRFDGMQITIADGTTPPFNPPLVPQPGDTYHISGSQGMASKMAVASEVVANTDKIAAGESPDAGDNSVALRINELQMGNVMNGGTATFETYFGEIVGRVGVIKLEAETNEQHYSSIVEQLEVLKSSVSGVSLDEEMTQIMKFQYAFQASSKLITVTDQLFQTLLDTLRR
ncbi:MAG: flagellar hook-associated protein FlgK [Deltaproteobacteria bacterium]|nr:flagellar hook-associated protein FlgK [Deltaproteobacteria bacterium]